ncbi:MAG: tRNA (adenosine(37)-N6)-threonylcarbamoyltransferase complex ATPase subunit type 1 TsaE [Lactobacillaceae bacterium]|jgi:tRNA threonylcarbamoyladenosine biosynthesis protein TsaE|nr:tRNA (adenosine(37)-N6)-threonylcarbamoyltransferase complex ATPase subunit type 1 TsaE [Lactobacillaceae bacterium]
MSILVQTAEETQAIAAKIARLIKPGDTILLNGDLGAGKTTFAQGFARALGITRPLKSPTFTLVREYETAQFPLYHLDVYRLGEEGGADELGLEEYFAGQGVALVEWAEFIGDQLPSDVLRIDLARVAGDSTQQQRRLTLTATGARSQTLVDALENSQWN